MGIESVILLAVVILVLLMALAEHRRNIHKNRELKELIRGRLDDRVK